MGMTIDILVMAGGSDPQWYQPPIENKALIPVHGKPCLEWIAEAIQNVKNNPAISQQFPMHTILLGTKILQEKGFHKHFDTFVLTPKSTTLSDNVRLGMEQVKGDVVLIITGDIPCIRAEHIIDLLKELQETDGIDIYVPIIEKSSVDNHFPGSRRTYGKIKEGSVKIANCFMIRQSAFSKVDAIMNQFIESRKSVLRLAFHFGFLNLLKLLITKSISIPELEKAFYKASGICVKGILTDHAQLAVDIDKASDIEDIEKYFQKRGNV
jgi:CTP:molybdopterin cytidylyltransferase MocA